MTTPSREAQEVAEKIVRAIDDMSTVDVHVYEMGAVMGTILRELGPAFAAYEKRIEELDRVTDHLQDMWAAEFKAHHEGLLLRRACRYCGHAAWGPRSHDTILGTRGWWHASGDEIRACEDALLAAAEQRIEEAERARNAYARDLTKAWDNNATAWRKHDAAQARVADLTAKLEEAKWRLESYHRGAGPCDGCAVCAFLASLAPPPAPVAVEVEKLKRWREAMEPLAGSDLHADEACSCRAELRAALSEIRDVIGEGE